MKSYELLPCAKCSEGIIIEVLCGDIGVWDDLASYIGKQELPYLESIDGNRWSPFRLKIWLHVLTEKHELDEFEAIVHGYFSGDRVIPRHFIRATTFLPQDRVQPARASWHICER